MSDSGQLWQPSSRLGGRVTSPGPRRSVRSSGRDPRLIAAAILIAALTIAFVLWIAALWAQGRSDEGPDEIDEIEEVAPVSAGPADYA